MRSLVYCLVCICSMASFLIEASQDSPFNDAQIKEPTTSTGPPLSPDEFEIARLLPPRLPSSSDPSPPLDRIPHFRNYYSYAFTKWPNGRVPYTIDESFNQQQRITIAQAIQHVEDAACVRFHPKTGSDQDFMHIYGDEKESCWADDRYEAKKGQHSVHLHRQYCVFFNVVAHEILHLLGVGHEQQRPDRDQYIAVNWTNIHTDHVFNFFKDSWDDVDLSSIASSTCPNWRDMAAKSPLNRAGFSDCTSGLIRKDYGVGYDYKSIMHYEKNFFAIDSNYGTLVPRDPRFSTETLGGKEMSQRDIAKLRAAYQCNGREPSGCGGHFMGEGGDIELKSNNYGDSSQKSCEWLLTVEDGNRIQIDFSDFNVDCSEGNVTIFNGIKQLNKVHTTYCGQNKPPASLTMPENCATVEFHRQSSSSNSRFSATWKKSSVNCCRTISIGLSRRSKAYSSLRYYLGVYRIVGNLNGAPMYRLQSNYNVWLARTLPLSSFSTAAWAVGHDLDLSPGQISSGGSGTGLKRRGPKLFLGGNAKCPRLLEGLFYRTRNDEAYQAEPNVKIKCLR